jgi:hypothetical protein
MFTRSTVSGNTTLPYVITLSLTGERFFFDDVVLVNTFVAKLLAYGLSEDVK